MDIDTLDHLLAHPTVGTSWEGFCIEHVIAKLPYWRPYFLRTSNGAEVDLVIQKGSRIFFFKFKSSKAPKLQRGFLDLMSDLQPEKSWVLVLVDKAYSLRKNITAMHPVAFMQTSDLQV